MKSFITFLFLLLSSVFSKAQTVTIYRGGTIISPSYTSIKSAVAAAIADDSLVLSADTFKENMIVIDKQLSLNGTIGASSKSIVTGQGGANVILFSNPLFPIIIQLHIRDLMITRGHPLYPSKGGGAIAADTCTVLIIDGASLLNGHLAYSTPTKPAPTLGAAIYSEGDVIIKGNTVITDNYATHGNGTIYSTKSVTIMENAVLSYNAADSAAGIFCHGDILIKGNAVIEENDGGGIFASGHVTVSDNAVIRKNYSTEMGAGIHAESGFLINGNAIIKENTSAKNGGGIYFSGEGFVQDSALVSNNSAANGGGIFADNGNLHLTNKSVISGNKSIGFGGAVALINSNFIMSDSVLIGFNTTDTNYAAAIYAKGNNDLIINGGQIIGNHATSDTISGLGMAIYNDSATGGSAIVRVNSARIFNPKTDFSRQNEVYNTHNSSAFLSDSTWWGESDTTGLFYNTSGAAVSLRTWVVANWSINNDLPTASLSTFPVSGHFKLNTGAALKPKMYWMLRGYFSCDSGTFSPTEVAMPASNIIGSNFTIPFTSNLVGMLVSVDADTFRRNVFVVGTSVKEQSLNNKLKFTLYPNPSNGALNIIKPAGLNSPITATLSDLYGRIILQQQLEFLNNKCLINISSAGQYALTLKDEQGNVWREKITVF